MTHRLSMILGILLGVLCIVRAFFWAGGWHYLIAGFVLLATAVICLRGLRIQYLTAAYGIFVGVFLFDLVSSVEALSMGISHGFLPILYLAVAGLGTVGLALTLSAKAR